MSNEDHNLRLFIGQLLNAATEPMVMLDRRRTICQANQAFYSACGQPQDAIAGRPIEQLAGELWRGPALPRLLAALRAGQPPATPIELADSGGRQFQAELRAIRLPGGAPALLLALRGHDGLRASQERLALAQRAAGIGTFEWMIKDEQIVWTAEMEALYGLPAGGFEGRYDSWIERIHPADRPDAEAALWAALRGGQPYEAEFRALLPGGHERWILAKGDVYRDAYGEAVRIIGVNIDITERKRVSDALNERRQQLELGLAAANMGAWEWDIASGALHCTPICKAHFGFAPDADVRIPEVIGRLHPDDTAAMRRSIADTIEQHAPFQAECRVCWPDGTTRWIRAAGRMIQPEPRADTRMVGVTLDLTAERQAVDERDEALAGEQAALAEARQALRLRDEFLSIASHELKTPLTAVLGNAQLLQRRTLRDSNLPSVHQRTIGIIVDQSRRLEKLINDLLDISRLEMGHLKLNAEQLDLAELARQVVEEVQPALYISHTVVAAIRAAPVLIAGDPLRLEQVLQNLIQNAIKYSPNGGQIVVRIDSTDTHAHLSVSDQGIGIPALAVPQLFSRFYRASNVHEQSISGMGIGLYVVKEIVSLHNGTIMVSSQEGAGSTFTIELPLAQPHERALQAGE